MKEWWLDWCSQQRLMVGLTIEVRYNPRMRVIDPETLKEMMERWRLEFLDASTFRDVK